MAKLPTPIWQLNVTICDICGKWCQMVSETPMNPGIRGSSYLMLSSSVSSLRPCAAPSQLVGWFPLLVSHPGPSIHQDPSGSIVRHFDIPNDSNSPQVDSTLIRSFPGTRIGNQESGTNTNESGTRIGHRCLIRSFSDLSWCLSQLSLLLGFCKTLHHCYLGYSQRECE